MRRFFMPSRDSRTFGRGVQPRYEPDLPTTSAYARLSSQPLRKKLMTARSSEVRLVLRLPNALPGKPVAVHIPGETAIIVELAA